jgi:hypothetical protein
MTEYITYNHFKFDDVGVELYKFSIALSIATRMNKTLVFFNDEYMSILDTFVGYKYKQITVNEFNKINFRYINYDSNNYDGDIYISFKNDEEYKLEDIDDNIRNLMSILLASNEKYNRFVYKNINDIMNYFRDYELNNYVCIYLKKDNYRKDYYKTVFEKYFKEKKLIIFKDDEDDNNIDITDEKIVYELTDKNKYSTFILMSMIPNMILGDINANYFSYYSAFMGNKNKKVVINKMGYKIDEWISYIDENIENT